MADTVTPQPNVPQLLASSIPADVHNALMDQVHSLAKKHFQISGLLIAVLVGVLALGGLGAYFAAKWVDRSLARAEQSEALYKTDKATSDKAINDLKTQLDQSTIARAAAEARATAAENRIATIAADAEKKKSDVLKPGKTASDAYADLAGQYKLSAPINIVSSPDKTEQELAFPISDVQNFTAAAIDRDAAQAESAQKDEIIKQKQAEIDGLKSDLAKANAALADLQKTDKQCQDALNKYKNVAKMTKFKKILHGAIKGIEIGGAIILGYEIGTHLPGVKH